MNKKLAFVFSLVSMLFAGCNSVADKDVLIAKVGNEPIYEEDINLLTLNRPSGMNSEIVSSAVDELFLSTILTAKILMDDPGLEVEWKSYLKTSENRLKFFIYQNYFIKERLGQSDLELRDFFNSNKSLFDTTRSYETQRKDVAIKNYLHVYQDSLNRYMAANISSRDEPRSARIGAALGDSAETMVWDSLAKAGALSDSIFTMGILPVYDESQLETQKDSVVKKYIFDSDSLQVGDFIRVELDSTQNRYVFIKIFDRKDKVIAKIEDYRSEFEAMFIGLRERFLENRMQKILDDNQEYVVEKIEPLDPKSIYEKNKGLFKTVPGYELYHIASADSAKLNQVLNSVAQLESFKAYAKANSMNKETAARDGLMGKVKVNYALPYGVGLMPELFAELEGKSKGYVSSVHKSEFDSLYHIFYVSAVYPSEQKPMDRIGAALNQVYLSNPSLYDTSLVLVTKNGTPLIRHADMLRVLHAEKKDSVPKGEYDKLLTRMFQSAVFSDEMEKVGIARSWEYRALIRQVRKNFMTENLKNFKQDFDALEKVVYSDNYYKFVYYINLVRGKTTKSYEEDLPNIKKKLKLDLVANYKTYLGLELWNGLKPHMFNAAWMEYSPKNLKENLIALADSAVKNNQFETAINAYQNLMNIYSSDDSLFKASLLNLGQCYSDNEKYDEATIIYETFLKVYPDSPEAEKAMFSLGFVLSENLNNNTRALQVLQEFQQKYPKSEMKESVDWLVQNIKSNGKLADDLMKKINAEK